MLAEARRLNGHLDADRQQPANAAARRRARMIDPASEVPGSLNMQGDTTRQVRHDRMGRGGVLVKAQ